MGSGDGEDIFDTASPQTYRSYLKLKLRSDLAMLYKQIPKFVFYIITFFFIVMQSAYAVDKIVDWKNVSPKAIYTSLAKSKWNSRDYQKLMQFARERGRIRVIVGLNLKMKAAHMLSAGQAELQANALGAAQRRVATRVLGSSAAQVEGRLQFIPYVSMSVTPNQLRLLYNDPEVVMIRPDTPSSPQLSKSTKIIEADKLWLKKIVGNGQTIAIIDTGVDKFHEMFGEAGEKVVSQACYEIGGAEEGIKPSCVDGVPSWIRGGSGINCAYEACDHGTHVAGIAAGLYSNGLSLSGVARGADVVSINVYSYNPALSEGFRLEAYDTDILKALMHVYELSDTYRIAAVNISSNKFLELPDSFCDDYLPDIAYAFRLLTSKQIAVVVSSGNDKYNLAKLSAYGCISSAIAVGNSIGLEVSNSKNFDRVAQNSQHSKLVSLLAPGTLILSAGLNSEYIRHTGTSMAAPHVAGAIALLRSAEPSASIDEMLEALICTGKDVDMRTTESGGLAPVSHAVPRIDVSAAHTYLSNPVRVSNYWNFDSASQIGSWRPVHGKWYWRAGAYVGEVIPDETHSGWFATKMSNCNSHLRITIGLKWNDIPISIIGRNEFMGVLFQSILDTSESRMSGSILGIYRNSAGGARLWTGSIDEIEFVGNGGATGSGCGSNVSTPEKDVVELAVEIRGSKRSIYFNGELQCESDSVESFYVGDIMLLGYSNPRFEIVPMRFDSVRIETIDALPSLIQAGRPLYTSGPAPSSADGKDPRVRTRSPRKNSLMPTAARAN